MTPGEMVRVGLEAAIVAQFSMLAVFLAAQAPRLTPVKALLWVLCAVLSLAVALNAMASAGLIAGLRGANVALELAVGPVVFLLVRQLSAPERAPRSVDFGHLLLPVAGGLLALSPWASRVDVVAIAAAGGYALASATVVWARRRRFPAAKVEEFARILVGWLALVWMLRMVVTAEVASVGGYRGGVGYPAVLLVIVFLSSRALYLAFRDPDVLLAIARRPKYAASALDPADVAILRARLDDLITTQAIHREPDIDLEAAAARLGATPRELSQLVNGAFGETFPSLMNRLRVEEAAHRLAGGEEPITDLIYAVGFGSKSAFNREFQRRMGATPSAYRAAARGRR